MAPEREGNLKTRTQIWYHIARVPRNDLRRQTEEAMITAFKRIGRLVLELTTSSKTTRCEAHWQILAAMSPRFDSMIFDAAFKKLVFELIEHIRHDSSDDPTAIRSAKIAFLTSLTPVKGIANDMRMIDCAHCLLEDLDRGKETPKLLAKQAADLIHGLCDELCKSREVSVRPLLRCVTLTRDFVLLADYACAFFAPAKLSGARRQHRQICNLQGDGPVPAVGHGAKGGKSVRRVETHLSCYCKTGSKRFCQLAAAFA